MKRDKDKLLYAFHTEPQVKILELLWREGPLTLEDITNALKVDSKKAYEELENLVKRHIVGKRVEAHSYEREVYYPKMSKERRIELCEIALKYSSMPPGLMEIEEEERMRREIRKFARKTHL
ncbi:MAG: helix-turn-helix domain-containing protein [Thermoproteota archaeon]